VALHDNNVLGMVCTRQSTRDTSGNLVFDEGVVTVLTDLNPNGNYTIFIPRDTILAESQASAVDKGLKALTAETQSKLTEMTNENRMLRDQVALLTGQIRGVGGVLTNFDAIKGTAGSPIADSNSDLLPNFGLGGTDNTPTTMLCPLGEFVTGAQGFKRGQGPIEHMRWFCKKIIPSQ
jgi:hypothetical protein